MSRIDEYRQKLNALEHWTSYLLEESRLPGPRGNIELARAVAQEGHKDLFLDYATRDAEQAPVNTPEEFLAFCGVLGLGRLCTEGDQGAMGLLRRHASDPRWRIREAVAMALESYGRSHMDSLLAEMEEWSLGNPLEQRAAAAALCHPSLLSNTDHANRVLELLDSITASIVDTANRKGRAFKILRQGLGYCWSVAVSAHPGAGKPRMERWLASDDRDIRWIVKQNLAKKRLERMDAEWVASCRKRLAEE